MPCSCVPLSGPLRAGARVRAPGGDVEHWTCPETGVAHAFDGDVRGDRERPDRGRCPDCGASYDHRGWWWPVVPWSEIEETT